MKQSISFTRINFSILVYILTILSLYAFTPIYAQDSLSWVRTGGPPGGLGYDIRYNFNDIGIWYVTDAFAGVSISTDRGYTWKPSNTGIKSELGPTGDWIPIFCLTVDPINPQIVWIGTQWTGLVYKSIDGGQTWTEKTNGISIKYDMLSFRGFTVDPRSSDIVYAMGETTSSTPLPDMTGGQIYKTSNGGDSWEIIWDGGMLSALTRYMWIDPRDPDILFVSTGIFDRSAVSNDTLPDLYDGLGILKSIDGGQTWRELNQTNGLEMLHVGSLYMKPDNPDILLAAAGHLLVGAATDHILQQGYSPAGVYRTVDGGEHWQRVLDVSMSRPDEAFSSVEYSTSHPNIAYAGSENGIYRSEDGGATWELVSGGDDGWGPPGVLANWPIDLQCDPEDPNRIFANNYLGGNFLSEDSGRTWMNASQGYTGAILSDVAVDPTNPARVYAAGRTGIWLSDDAGNSWVGLRYGEAERIDANNWHTIEINPTNPSHLLGGGMNGITIVESHNGGESWEYRWSMWELWGPEVILKETENMVPTTIAFAPSNPTIVYAGGTHQAIALLHETYVFPGVGLLISSDGGQTWNVSENENISDRSVIDLAVDPKDEKVIYMATENGLYKSTDSGNTWSLLQIIPDGGMVRAVAVNPTDPEYILAAVEGLGIYISTDGGQIWQAGVAGLEPNGSIHDIVFDPQNPKKIYTSDYFSGVYRSIDGGYTWVKINNGLHTRSVTGLSISADGNHMYAATHGEGVFRLDLNGQVPSAVEISRTPRLEFELEQNFPNPFNPTTTIKYSLQNSCFVSLKIFNIKGQEIETLVNKYNIAGEHEVKWQPKGLSNGIYFYRLQTDDFSETKKLILQK